MGDSQTSLYRELSAVCPMGCSGWQRWLKLRWSQCALVSTQWLRHILSKSHTSTRKPNCNKQTLFFSKDVDIPYACFPTPIFYCLKWPVCPFGFVHAILAALCVHLQNTVGVIYTYRVHSSAPHTHDWMLFVKRSCWPFFTMVYIENGAGRSPHPPRSALRQTDAFLEEE